MDLTEGSKTSAKLNLMPWRHPKEHIQDSEHGENLKSRKTRMIFCKSLQIAAFADTII
jgi:hypothetical protein